MFTVNNSELTEPELKVMYYIFHSGPAFIKKLATRVNEDSQMLRNSVKNLQRLGYVERVTKTLVDYRLDKRNRSLVIVKKSDIEDGYFHEQYHLKTDKLKKTLKMLLRKEFPRSQKVRLYIMGTFNEEEVKNTDRKIL